MDFVLFPTLCLKPWVAFTTFASVKSCVLLSLKSIFYLVAKRESSMHWDDTIYKRKASRSLELGSANGGDSTKQSILLINMSHFPYRRSPASEQLLEEIKKGELWELFGYVQYDIEVPENFRSKINNFPPINQEHLSQQERYRVVDEKLCRRRNIFVSTSKNVDIQLHITKMNTYYSSPVVLSTIGSCLHKNTPLCWAHSKEMFQQFCAVSSGGKEATDGNPNSSVVAETMKLLLTALTAIRLWTEADTL